MKLINYTNSKLTILLLFLISIWGVFFFYAIHHEIMDETDDMLVSYRDIFVKKALHDPSLLDFSYETTFDRYSIRPITEEEAEYYKESWYDTEVYFPEGNEHIPVRVFKSIFLASDENYYELEISMSTLERDDMIKTLLVFLIGLYVVLLVCIVVGNRIILKKSFKPLEKLLAWLNSIVPGKPVPPLDNDTRIVEFSQLNEAAYAMSQRNFEVYNQQKQFIENASHELQTPLAVALNKLEMLTQSDEITEPQLKEIDGIYITLNRAVKLNKSLLLLSRIENRQFVDEKEMDFARVIQELIADLSEIYFEKEIQIVVDEKTPCTFVMNDTLARILTSNLLKNAFVHTPVGGEIIVTTGKDGLAVENSGSKSLDTNRVFERFYRDDEAKTETSTGLGLSIIKSICSLYHIDLQYNYQEKHFFVLKFPKK